MGTEAERQAFEKTLTPKSAESFSVIRGLMSAGLVFLTLTLVYVLPNLVALPFVLDQADQLNYALSSSHFTIVESHNRSSRCGVLNDVHHVRRGYLIEKRIWFVPDEPVPVGAYLTSASDNAEARWASCMSWGRSRQMFGLKEDALAISLANVLKARSAQGHPD